MQRSPVVWGGDINITMPSIEGLSHNHVNSSSLGSGDDFLKQVEIHQLLVMTKICLSTTMVASDSIPYTFHSFAHRSNHVLDVIACPLSWKTRVTILNSSGCGIQMHGQHDHYPVVLTIIGAFSVPSAAAPPSNRGWEPIDQHVRDKYLSAISRHKWNRRHRSIHELERTTLDESQNIVFSTLATRTRQIVATPRLLKNLEHEFRVTPLDQRNDVSRRLRNQIEFWRRKKLRAEHPTMKRSAPLSARRMDALHDPLWNQLMHDRLQ